MSFYTALTGLNGSQADIAATSNNIANVGTTGFKRSRAEFGDIFATSPLQNASSSIGSGTILKGIKQQFTQGNVASSLNALDLAISGQGFFTLKPSLSSSQTVYTRNGSLSVNNDRYVVDSAGQYLMVYPVNDDGSVTAKDLDSAMPLQLPVTSGDPKATSLIELGVNVAASAEVVTDKPQFAEGYTFDPDDQDTYTNSTSMTIFDDLGNPTIATMYFIKTQAASSEDPTNKYDTRLVIDGIVIDPDLVPAVDDSGRQQYIDRFGNTTSVVPDDNYFIEGKGSPLYKLDDLQTLVPSSPATLTGEETSFDFGEEGDKLVEIVTDPMQFMSTREAGNSSSDVYWGKDFLLVNVDDGDQPVSIDLRPGKYNAEQLAAEVERAINAAYGDDRKIQVQRNVDDTLTIDLFKLAADGTSEGLDDVIEVDLLTSSFVSDLAGIDTSGASPDFSFEEFLAHAQARINETLNDYAIDPDTDISNDSALGVDSSFFARALGEEMDAVLETTDIVTFTRNYEDTDSTSDTYGEMLSTDLNLVHSYYNNRSTLNVYERRDQVSAVTDTTDTDYGKTMSYNAAQNTLTIYMDPTTGFADNDNGNACLVAGETIRIAGDFVTAGESGNGGYLNGRAFTVLSVDETNGLITVDTTNLALPDADFTIESTSVYLMSDESDTVEAFYEGASDVIPGSTVNYNSSKLVVREFGADALHDYTNASFAADTSSFNTAGLNIFEFDSAALLNVDADGETIDTVALLGLDGATIATQWVDEKAPPVSIYYDEINQRFSFEVDRSILGMGTDSGFNSFKIGGDTSADSTNGLGIPAPGDASTVLIRGGEVFYGEPFVADGEEVQLNDKRYGITVTYNSDTQNFSFASGSTGEAIAADGAIGVTTAQKASNIQVGRYSISSTDGSVLSSSVDADSRYLGVGDNQLMGVGASKSDALFVDGRGLAASAAVAIGGTANEDLGEIFRLSTSSGETTFNISVNGISGVIQVPSGNYVGTTLAAALEERINQIQDPLSGDTVGGVKVRYSSADNNFTFTTGTTGSDTTIKVKGTARLGLADVPLGVGSVPMIYNLVQATNDQGIALYVDANGNTVESPPENMVTGYYPLYIDEGELTFDKSGKLLSPQNMVSYEQQEAGFSISLQVDFAGSTQLAQPFSVLSVEQDGFTSGRLDGLEIDSSGTIRANYTNGQNNPLGKIVIANFNNQNGLKQIGNATYVATAVSGSPSVGEAGSEGFGSILSGSLERSNVDITEELVNLITAQRNYQASAKAIETSTSLTQTIINIRM